MSRRPRWDNRPFDTLEYISVAEQTTCPVEACAAEPAKPCVGALTHEPLPVSHWQRFKAATQLLREREAAL